MEDGRLPADRVIYVAKGHYTEVLTMDEFANTRPGMETLVKMFLPSHWKELDNGLWTDGRGGTIWIVKTRMDIRVKEVELDESRGISLSIAEFVLPRSSSGENVFIAIQSEDHEGSHILDVYDNAKAARKHARTDSEEHGKRRHMSPDLVQSESGASIGWKYGCTTWEFHEWPVYSTYPHEEVDPGEK